MAGGNSAEFLEIVNEVGLIVIATLGRDLRPDYLAGLPNLIERALKPTHATKYFRREAHLPATTDL
jgi:hypothetical protein